ncbi:MAG: hypothetical protein H6623_00200 [Bdellovibrionaceae bacterium]|nr:hypothetical protein [Pseudobdellovibrionaceae bacterium]
MALSFRRFVQNSFYSFSALSQGQTPQPVLASITCACDIAGFSIKRGFGKTKLSIFPQSIPSTRASAMAFGP